jgi:hypothetical protein
VLVAVVAILWRCIERARSRGPRGLTRRRSRDIVEAQRLAAVKATQVNVEQIAEALNGGDPEGDVADIANDRRSDR